MNLRTLLLRIMLIALAAAACSGVLAIIVPSTSITWRLAGMGGVAAVCTAAMFSMSRWIDDRAARNAGLFGMALCVLLFVLSVVLIWGDLVHPNLQEFVGLSMLMLAITGIPAIFCVRMIGEPDSKRGGVIGLCGLGLALACLLDACADSAFGIAAHDERLWITGFALFFAAFLTALCLVGWTSPDPRKWRWIGVLGALAALGMTMYGTWIKSGGEPVWLAIAYTLAAATAHAILFLRLPLPEWAWWIRIGTILATIGTGVLICCVVHVDGGWNDTFGFARLATGAGIIAGSGSLAMLVLARFAKRTAAELAPKEITSVALTCPRCSRKLTLPIGGGACGGCQLRITVTLANPRCAKCDYDLSNISSTRCPECGEPIRSGA